MNKRQANRLAKQKYGVGGAAQSVSAVDRNQRFGIMFCTPGGAFQKPVLGCLGHGASFQQAWDMAQNNPVAQQLAKQWSDTKQDFKEFGEDPQAYIKKRVEVIEKENNNG